MASPNGDTYDSHARKRVGKACDRCRLKKSKCDGANPCNRCKIDNTICVFGERKKSHDRVYPKGYVEMLEHQQHQIVAGLRSMYHLLLEHGHWPGSSLKDYDGNPLTHDMLERLGVLQIHDDGPDSPTFEDDLDKLQDRMKAENGVSTPRTRRLSPFTDEEPELDQSTPHGTPVTADSSISIPYSRKRSPETSPRRVTVKKPKYAIDLLPSKRQPMPQCAQPIDPFTFGSPDLDLSGLDLNSFLSNSAHMFSSEYLGQYAQQNFTNVSSSNEPLGQGFDAEFDMFQHSGLPINATYPYA